MFYDTSSTYREAYGKFFRSGTLLPDSSSSVPIFWLRSFCSFYFLFLVSFLFARDRLDNNPAKVFPCGQISTFSLLSLPFFGSRLCFSCSPPAPTPDKSSRLRWFFVDDHFITKMTTQEKPFQRPSPRRSFHDHLRKYGRSSQVLEWFLSITQHWVAQSKCYRLTACSWFPSCWERDEEVEKGDGERKKNRNGINRLPFRSMSATLASVSSTRAPVLHHSNALS